MNDETADRENSLICCYTWIVLDDRQPMVEAIDQSSDYDLKIYLLAMAVKILLRYTNVFRTFAPVILNNVPA
jgi:hypothetical protein